MRRQAIADVLVVTAGVLAFMAFMATVRVASYAVALIVEAFT